MNVFEKKLFYLLKICLSSVHKNKSCFFFHDILKKWSIGKKSYLLIYCYIYVYQHLKTCGFTMQGVISLRTIMITKIQIF